MELGTSASVTIRAPVEKVWLALTTPDLIQRWFFGVRTETSWEVGAPIVHRGEYQGEPYEDKGEILRFEPPSRLAHTHWSAGSGLPDEPENYQEVTWSLSRRDDAGTDLTVTERNLPNERTKEISEKSWPMALRALRDLLESG